METKMEELISQKKETTSFFFAGDVLFRAPLWALVVILFLGGIAFGVVWFIIHVIEPYMHSML